ncbi:MAG: YdiU family protein [Myxococcales bacterium]|jgi:uncharacterized protein YdiU (UPF0061 family)|nr:YdiU family protein [Myxococcales bacterium]MBL0194355.1 YdiU family protein [Myxococcales bacterium]HQY61600.1 YdiU family protein [Polyangiaceae bacterium]
MKLAFDNSYARLFERMYARVSPTPVRSPTLLRVNRALAERLGVDAGALASAEGIAMLAGSAVPEGAEPIALAYAGHQFGSFVRQLGDGRAVLLGELVAPDGARHDLQLKGAGRTPFSRGGDGRAALGPVLREYLVSEAMAALGIPTTRALAAVATGELVHREEALPGAVLARVAASHLRVGTFEYFAAREDTEALRALTSHALARHYPGARPSAEPGGEALALLERVIEAQARLVARWMGVGFVHGVMNTDNTSIAGETIDYGPCAFLDTYDPSRTFSSIDRGGRYAFGNQPRIALWNLTRLAEALLPLLAADERDAVRLAEGALEGYVPRFEAAYGEVLRAKLGLSQVGGDDLLLARDLLQRMAAGHVDHTRLFRRLCESARTPDADAEAAALFDEPGAFLSWAEEWRRRLAEEPGTAEARAEAMSRANPAFIPRNHRVEEALLAAREGDLEPFETLHAVLARPFDDQPEHAHLAAPPGAEFQEEYRTFCGT